MSCSVLLFSFEGVLADTAPLLRSALRESLSAEELRRRGAGTRVEMLEGSTFPDIVEIARNAR